MRKTGGRRILLAADSHPGRPPPPQHRRRLLAGQVLCHQGSSPSLTFPIHCTFTIHLPQRRVVALPWSRHQWFFRQQPLLNVTIQQ